ncbi:MAG: RNA polymerase factor sigma-54 [Treponema sp.]|nr:RNA polymerase factor sigma-54 [Treponema sp.]
MQASFVQRQQLGLKMSPQMYQSIKLMELPLVDLREKIAEELDRNPALELLEDRSTVSLDSVEPGQKEVEEYFEATSDSGFTGAGAASASDDHHHFMEGMLTRPETLQQHLLWQLQLEPVDDGLRAIAATLIQNLDDDGFHSEPPETLFREGPGFAPRLLDEAMELVRTLDPVGCCTADYRESLKAQVSMLRNDPGCMECPMDHLELFEKGRFSAAAKMRCGKDNARACFNLMKKLSPFPGRRFSVAGVRFVVPDIQVARDGDDFVVMLNNEVIPVLGINPFFMKLNPGGRVGGGRQDQSVHEFARENVRDARVFIQSIAMRNHTLKMTVRALLKFQRPFFEDGPKYLVPLTLNDIAMELGVHQATVSRIANGKYMQTEWGIFELRRFFTNSISGTGSAGSQYSKEGVKAIIRELVEAENRSLSDHDISELLAERGISLARRTVAKYRKELDLGSSYAREHGTMPEPSKKFDTQEERR